MSKTFVSISFSTSSIQVLSLNSNKTKVEKLTTVAIPKGLITNYRVRDKAKLAEIIKATFSGLKVGEKSVGIVVPEFSTFTKLITVPKLEPKEIDEAVRWQAQEFIPDSKKDMVMDWKIIDSGLSGNRVLLVAIDREVLSGYIDAVGLAGLSPVLVETQSLSLLRITDGSNSGKLLIYKNFGEVVLSVVFGRSVLGSSVIADSDDNTVLRTVSQMAGHYRNVKIERIVVAGSGFGQDFYSVLGKSFGRNVEGIQQKVTGISSQDYQNYLIPISLQLEDPLEPMDATTINLLPPDWVKKYSNKKLKTQIWGLMAVASLVILGCFLATLFAYVNLNNRLSETKMASSPDGELDQATSQVLAEVSSVNDLANRVSSIDSVTVHPQEIINIISAVRPSGVVVEKYTIDLEKGNVSLYGIAATRQELIGFKNSLEENEEFGNVNIPLSLLEAESDISYELSFSYLPITPQKKIKLKLN